MKVTEAIKKVTPTHVKRAIAEIDRSKIPMNRRSKRWCLKIGSAYYPPKYVLSIAVKIAAHHELAPRDHSAGEQTNTVLRRLGFEVVECSMGSNIPEE